MFGSCFKDPPPWSLLIHYKLLIMLQNQSSSREEQKFFICILCLKRIGRYRLYLTDTDTTTDFYSDTIKIGQYHRYQY